MLKAFIAA